MLVLPLMLAASTVVMPVVRPGKPDCDSAPMKVAARGAPILVRPLTQEPPAKQLKAVADYDMQGCLKPRIVSEQVGPPARR